VPSSDAWKILVLSDDPIVLAALQRIASQHGPSYSLERDLVARLERDPSWRSEAPPGAVVLDASDSDTTSRVVSAACQAWPHAVMIGFLAAPDRTKWRAAELAGCDVVTTRGALSRQLPSALAGARRGAARQRLALCDADDLAGRLGLIVHLDDSPVGLTGPRFLVHPLCEL
jgi:DNA-binding response OmpR family regulator